MKPYYQDEQVTLYHGDNREVLKTLPDNSVDACVTDPPYELGFMGRKWDSSGIAYDVELWCEVLRVLKPGGHLLAFGGTRTWHRLAVAIEDAGFDVRDSMAWMYGSGFPKSLDVSKAIDKAAGAEREVLSTIPDRWAGKGSVLQRSTQSEAESVDITAPATPAAKQWQGWGTALKPAFEPVIVARKPLIGTVAENVQQYGTGALNIDACRIGYASDADKDKALAGDAFKRKDTSDKGWSRPWMEDAERVAQMNAESKQRAQGGRWPANVILDESQAAELDKQSGVIKGGTWNTTQGARHFNNDGETTNYTTSKTDNTSGGASRFFYTAKASKKERPNVDGIVHPTVKPIKLMQYLVRLITPPGGTVLEPFAGSGTTIEACLIEGFNSIAIELTPEYLPLIMERINRNIETTLL
jgi:site-specific DNA-methyltransferase (adenine-specific)